MKRKYFVLFSVMIILASVLAACGPNTAQRATMTAMFNDLNKANTQLAEANVQLATLTFLPMELENVKVYLTDTNKQLFEANDKIATFEAQAAAKPKSNLDKLYGKWIDQVKDTWDFQQNGKLYAVSKGVPYETTWYSTDEDTIVVDFGPILGKVGQPAAILTLDYVVTDISLSLKFANGTVVPLTRMK